MIFETERLYVAKWKAGDLKVLYGLFNDPAIKEFILPTLTIKETKYIFEQQLIDYDKDFPFGRYFIVKNSGNDFIGLFLLREKNNKPGVEIGYSLKKEHWNKGYATELVKQSIYWLTEQQKFSGIYAVTELNNIKSQHVLLKCGFNQEENVMEDGKEMSLFSMMV